MYADRPHFYAPFLRYPTNNSGYESGFMADMYELNIQYTWTYFFMFKYQ